VDRVDRRGFALNVDGGDSRSDVKGKIQGGGSVDLQHDIFFAGGCESASIDGNGVGSGRNLQKLIYAALIRLLGAAKCGGGIGEQNLRAADHGGLRIRNCSTKRRGGALRPGSDRTGENNNDCGGGLGCEGAHQGTPVIYGAWAGSPK